MNVSILFSHAYFILHPLAVLLLFADALYKRKVTSKKRKEKGDLVHESPTILGYGEGHTYITLLPCVERLFLGLNFAISRLEQPYHRMKARPQNR